MKYDPRCSVEKAELERALREGEVNRTIVQAGPSGTSRRTTPRMSAGEIRGKAFPIRGARRRR